jgi:hypothetical protein
MFEQAFKTIDDVLWKEAGCTTELDYTEQTSWLLFLTQNRRANLRRRLRLGRLLVRGVRLPAVAARPDHEGRPDASGALLFRQGEEVGGVPLALNAG